MSQFDSVGARADGTMRIAARALPANLSPISASSGGAGLWRQLDGNLLRRNGNARNAVRDLRRDHHQIVRRLVRIDMDKVFDHGQREMGGRVRKTSTWARPASAEKIRALSVQRLS